VVFHLSQSFHLFYTKKFNFTT